MKKLGSKWATSIIYYDNKVRELIAVSTYIFAEYHRGRLQNTPLGELCTDANA